MQSTNNGFCWLLREFRQVFETIKSLQLFNRGSCFKDKGIKKKNGGNTILFRFVFVLVNTESFYRQENCMKNVDTPCWLSVPGWDVSIPLPPLASYDLFSGDPKALGSSLLFPLLYDLPVRRACRQGFSLSIPVTILFITLFSPQYETPASPFADKNKKPMMPLFVFSLSPHPPPISLPLSVCIMSECGCMHVRGVYGLSTSVLERTAGGSGVKARKTNLNCHNVEFLFVQSLFYYFFKFFVRAITMKLVSEK